MGEMSREPFGSGGGTFEYGGYQVPIALAKLTGGGPDTFQAIADAHMIGLGRHVGIRSDHRVLELGCGVGRDAIALTQVLSDGSYWGVDIIEPSIEWCQRNISAKHENFTFIHFDVADQLHNVQGTGSTQEFTLPIEDRSIDRVIAWSVFTHMWESDIRHYLREIRRILRPEGLAFLTCFAFNEDVLETARAKNLTIWNLRFDFEIYDGCRINDPRHPLGAISFSDVKWQEIVAQEGLFLERPILPGAWSGYYQDPEDGQDVLILTNVDKEQRAHISG